MNIHDHYEPEDAPTHDEREHGLFIIDVPLTYHERLEAAAQNGDVRADFELWWRTIGQDIPDRAILARKAWLNLAKPDLMEECISPFLCYEQDEKLMAWQCYAMANAVYIAECEIANARAGCDCADADDEWPFEPQKPDQTQIDAFGVIADETDGFDNWWAEDGSGIPKCEWHDAKEHAHKVALFAYRAGMEQAKGGAK